MTDLVLRLKRSWQRVARASRQHLLRHSPAWIRRAFGRPATYLDMVLVDHGIFRLIYLNRHRLSAEAWRSAQPAPHQFRWLAESGIRNTDDLRRLSAVGPQCYLVGESLMRQQDVAAATRELLGEA